jgi:hypothetical protein
MTLRWLGSPAVALVSFLASVVTLGQLAFVVGRGACRVAQAAGSRLWAWLALALVAVAAVAMPLTWQPIVAEVSGGPGEGGWAGETYPVMVTGLALAGALVLLVAAIEKRRPPVMAWLSVAGGFAVCAFLVVAHGGLSLPA